MRRIEICTLLLHAVARWAAVLSNAESSLANGSSMLQIALSAQAAGCSTVTLQLARCVGHVVKASMPAAASQEVQRLCMVHTVASATVNL